MPTKHALLSSTPTLLTALAAVAAAWLFSLSMPTSAGAQPDGEQRQRRGPPPEALAACKSLAQGASCSFTGRRGTLEGSCLGPQGSALACRPADAARAPQGTASAPKR